MEDFRGMSSTFSELVRKAHGAIANLRGENHLFLGKNGEVIYSKNNVCVHELEDATTTVPADDNVIHTPGYLTVRCQHDDNFGVTLVLQWLPNATLERNPASIRCVSPRENSQQQHGDAATNSAASENTQNAQCKLHITSETVEDATAANPQANTANRPSTLEKLTDNCGGLGVPRINVIPNTPIAAVAEDNAELCNNSTPSQSDVIAARRPSESSEASGSTSGADEISVDTDDSENTFAKASHSSSQPLGANNQRKRNKLRRHKEDDAGEAQSSSDYDSSPSDAFDDGDEKRASGIETYRKNCETIMHTIPEQFAKEHNMIMDTIGTSDEHDTDENDGDAANATAAVSTTDRSVSFRRRSTTSDNDGASFADATTMTSLRNRPLFSVNLGKMRSMRIFYSNAECTSGELVIASPHAQYKILHFHHGGLDKLAKLFGHWNVIKSKSMHDGSPSAAPDRHLLICQPAVSRTELDPEDGLYNRVGVEFWRSYQNANGSIDDAFTIRKAIYFASMDAALRREIWPFLLRVYPWNSTFEQRETVYNQCFLAYQNIKRTRLKIFAAGDANAANGGTSSVKATDSHATHSSASASAAVARQLANVACTIWKDVVRTDRRNPFFAGENNPNLETMNSILLNYAVAHPSIGYVQGMSDLIAPLLNTLKDESLTYACFANLMHQTLFCAPTEHKTRNLMEVNLTYLRELLKLLASDFYSYLWALGGDAPQLMFVHRWILLFFKREFAEMDALHMWEACWAKYRTSYFHLFVCVAIVVIYGADIVAQRLPHDEILLYFSSLAMHMDANVVLKKARGLLYNFYRLPRIPCTLAGVCELSDATNEQWSSHVPQHVFECTGAHDNNEEACPFAKLVPRKHKQ